MLLLRRSIAGVAAALLVVACGLVLASCGDSNAIEKLPPDKVIERAAVAIRTPQSFHFTFDTANMHKLPGLWLVKAEGDAVQPDKMVGQVNARYNDVPLVAKVVVEGKAQYWTDPLSGKWGPMPLYFDISQFFDPVKGVTEILKSIQNLTDDGTEDVNGVTCYRIKGAVPPKSLQVMTSVVDVKENVPTTVWIGAKDFLVRKVRLTGALINGEPSTVERTVTVSDYDKPVKIETPVVR